MLVDFGCADAVLLKAIPNMKPNISLKGYDIDPEMIKHQTTEIPICQNTHDPKGSVLASD